MTGKVIENSATGILILIVPIAFIAVVLYSAWPLLLTLIALGITLRLWQQSQWQKLSQKINPYFSELIRENQGCITAIDLSLKASVTGSNAEYFLTKKAEEYGAQRKVYQDKGTVYYFLTASALGSIFEGSEPIWQLNQEPVSIEKPSPEVANIPEIAAKNITSEAISEEIAADLNFRSEVATVSEELTPTVEYQSEAISEEIATDLNFRSEVATVSEELTPTVEYQSESHQEDSSDSGETMAATTTITTSLLQGELAKRLDVHSSTVGKRKLDSDFSEWSQKKDPEGIAWQFSRRQKVFTPVTEGE